MTSSQLVLLIRHAEEPDAERGIVGIDEQGRPDDRDLSVVGWQRAGALVPFFAQPWRHGIVQPQALWAAAGSKSQRPASTLRPLALALGLPVDDTHDSEHEHDERRLVARLRARSGVSLVCWRHAAMAGLAAALTDGAVRTPSWDPVRFDLVWHFERQAGGTWRWSQLPQRLLAGDGDDVIR